MAYSLEEALSKTKAFKNELTKCAAFIKEAKVALDQSIKVLATGIGLPMPVDDPMDAALQASMTALSADLLEIETYLKAQATGTDVPAPVVEGASAASASAAKAPAPAKPPEPAKAAAPAKPPAPAPAKPTEPAKT